MTMARESASLKAASAPYLDALLDNIRSIHNVGSIFRTADAVGIRQLYLCGITPTPKQAKQKGKARCSMSI